MVGSFLYFHYDSPLGTVVTTRGRPLLGIPANQIAVNVINQDQTFTTLGAAQPVTALLKVRQGVKVAQADEQIARSQLEQGKRALLSGVEQLYWGLLAARRIRAGAQVAVQGAETMAKSDGLEARTALLEARQGFQAADSQVADVEEQLTNLLDLPPCTKLEPVEPPLPTTPVRCAADAIALALASSPEVREAGQNVVKAKAGVAVARVDYLPNVNLVGGYAHQEGVPAIQPDIGYLGVQGSYTFFEWGKRKNTVREREMLVAMAMQKLAQTQDEVRQKTQKAFRELEQNRDALQNATAMVQLRKEAVRKASDPKDALTSSRAQMEAEVELVKAELAYRVAHVQLMSFIEAPHQ